MRVHYNIALLLSYTKYFLVQLILISFYSDNVYTYVQSSRQFQLNIFFIKVVGRYFYNVHQKERERERKWEIIWIYCILLACNKR